MTAVAPPAPVSTGGRPTWGADPRNEIVRRRPATVAFVVWALVGGTGAGLISPTDTSSLVASTGSRTGALFAVVALAAVLVAIPKPIRTLPALLLAVTPLLFLTALAGVSVLWAAEPAQATQGVVRLLAGILVAAALAHRVPIGAVFRGLFWMAGSSSTAAVILTVAAGDLVKSDRGVWYGLYGWNSTAGLVAGVAIVVGLVAPPAVVPPTWRRWLLTTGAVLALLLSASRTAQISTLAGLGFVLAIRLFRRTHRLALLIVPFYGMISLAMSNRLRFAIFDLLGKDATLTDRANIWSVVVDEIGVRPLLGWGWRSYWFSDRATHSFQDFFRIPQHSHNQFLEVTLQVGLLGGFLFVVIVWQLGEALLRLNERGPTTDADADTAGAHVADRSMTPMLFGLFGLLMTQTTANAFLLQNTAFSVLFVLLLAVVPGSSFPLRRSAPRDVITLSDEGGATLGSEAR